MCLFTSTIVMLLVLILMANGVPSQGGNSPQRFGIDESQALEYLRRFGYLLENVGFHNESHITKTAIENFQRNFGLTPTGTLTDETLELMSKPRCGVKDTVGAENRFKYMNVWPKKDLTYVISKYSSSQSLSSKEIDQEIVQAFQVWSEHTDLTFRKARRNRDRRPDIDIKFVTFNHGDGSAFDGPGGILAHAFNPTNGAVHFDDTELWTLSSRDGVRVSHVAAHEFGHALGLDHSEIPTALMAPYYNPNQPKLQLHDDDIQGIKRLYGPKTRRSFPRSPSRPTNKFPLVNSLCRDLEFDTIFTDHKDVTHVFKGIQYWSLDGTYAPQEAQRKWPGLPVHIDAAFYHRLLAKTYFFSGAQVWRYQNEKLDKGYPMLISQRFKGIPDNLDAAFVWSRNNQIYFFKGSKFWKFDYTILPPVAYEYPRRILDWWHGVPDAPDVVFTRRGRVYVAKNRQFARIDDSRLQVDSAGYRCISTIFGCPNAYACRAPLEDKAWMADIISPRSPELTESLREPNHWACMKHLDCRNFP